MFYYTNNSGTRGVNRPNESLSIKLPSGEVIKRKAMYQEALGNFSFFAFKIKGKTVRIFSDSTDEQGNLVLKTL